MLSIEVFLIDGNSDWNGCMICILKILGCTPGVQHCNFLKVRPIRYSSMA